MVTLYTWLPPSAETIFEQALQPDVGHSALEVKGPDGNTRVYASFWPECDSLIGKIRELWKERPCRHPSSYEQDSDPDGAYMQRQADHADTIEGLSEDVIVDLWQLLQDSDYDFLRWNCSNVGKLLLLSAVEPKYLPDMEKAMCCTPDELLSISGADELLEKLRYLSTSAFLDCRPDDLRRAVQAYTTAKENAESNVVVTQPSPQAQDETFVKRS